MPLNLSIIAVLLTFFLSPLTLHASVYNADSIVGIWEVEEGDGHIRIYRCAEKYCGAIAWLKESVYPPDDRGKMAGKPLVDRENPKKELKGRPLLGLEIMAGYTFRGDNLWSDGRIYNNENGKTYNSRVTMLSTDRLELRGYLGIPLLGGSTIWKRIGKK